jgi:cell division protein FtsB
LGIGIQNLERCEIPQPRKTLLLTCTFRRIDVFSSPRVAKDPKRAAPKRPDRTRRIVQTLLLFIAAVIVVDALVGEQGLFAMLRARRQAEELAASIARQKAENARLREEVERLTNDPAAIEEVARRELGLIRPGEKVFIIKDLER